MTPLRQCQPREAVVSVRDTRAEAPDTNPMSGRIAFYLADEFHRAMLEPIYLHLQDAFPCLATDRLDSLVEFQPRIVVQADGRYAALRQQLPHALMVFTRHGFASKNFAKSAIAASDFTCVSSEWVRDDCVRRGWIPRLGYWITGFVPMDPVLRQSASPSPSIRAPGVPAGRPTILWAPTYNRLMGSVEILGSRWISQLHDRYPQAAVIIKPHPHTFERTPDWFMRFRELAQRNPRTHLIENPRENVYDYLPVADILLTDASSVMFYFLALDRPIILVNNPDCTRDARFDPEGPEWTWRDMGIEVSSAEQLAAALGRAVDRPEEKAAERARYRERVFGSLLDGRASERIADRIRMLLHPTAEGGEWARVTWHGLHALGALQGENSRLGQRLAGLEALAPLLPLMRWVQALAPSRLAYKVKERLIRLANGFRHGASSRDGHG